MTDDETASTPVDDQSSGAIYTCDNCESLLDLSSWTPTGTDDDGSVYRFCDEDCRAAWTDD